MYAVSILHFFNTNTAGTPTGGLFGYTVTGFTTQELAAAAAAAIQRDLQSTGALHDGTVHTKVTAYQMS